MNEQAIGFFDSGVGGLTVVREVLRQLPNEKIVYIGDTARAPYGPRPSEQVEKFSWELTEFLLKKKVKMLVIACNTATAVALDEIKKKLDIPVVGVILPGSRAAIKASKANKIGVIGTVGTIRSASYERILREKSPKTEVYSLACPKFVPLVESNEFRSAIAKKVVAESLLPFKLQKPDALILGCTHYPLLRPIIQQAMGSEVALIDSGAETVSDVSMLLDYFNLSAKYRNEITHEFYTTGSARMFEEIADSWLGNISRTIEHVNLEEMKNATT
ncbi:glutamate racemase [Pilibacter termitis]|uniref:Glutamate racemase n=1 Tax=Pilibacter termitis TaxID=263852 RepID=A0A1T4QPU5_9ENTE|nr:glutamate racemase [Pilibacter termitis]SKA05637.1 glutamate racemase [Pilibacter termitis]